MNHSMPLILLLSAGLLAACALPSQQSQPEPPKSQSLIASGKDPHSYSNPEQIKVRHLDLDLRVSFESKTLEGRATLVLDRAPGSDTAPLVLDTHDLKIARVESAEGSGTFRSSPFKLGAPDKILGAPLEISLFGKADRVRIFYSTSPAAAALQWLSPAQTAGKRHPFLFSQSQAIYARTWIPLQDTPSVRLTYTAAVRVPRELRALMSAENDPQQPRSSTYHFRMTQPIPSYLIAFAVGDLDFRPLGKRTGVYAEPVIADRAAKEFEDTEQMLAATEALYGPYRWGRYDLLVLPPSFPYGGMENPRLTFATPTIIAGDKSLVSLVAHELAHSWSGNLVTNATWSDFWLNEGFTTYVTHRIIEAVYGPQRSAMEQVLDRQELLGLMKTLPAADQILHIDLAGRNPEEGVTEVPYVKGALFLRHLEQAVGRARFDAFVQGYFDHFAFQSIRTADFANYLQQHLAGLHSTPVPVDEWIYQPGIPTSAPQPVSDALAAVEKQAEQWFSGQLPASQIETSGWSYHEWQHFLRSLQSPLSAARMAQLDAAFHFSQSGNAEILQQWLLMAIRNDYAPANAKLEEFLVGVGRRKFLKPLYSELAKTPIGRKRAQSIYRKARPGYHPIAVATIDAILNWKNPGNP
ncbi:MAG: M1 family metallopeptidase [Acidimicrobiia bacterium]|nr:M1 family metallopeptidase [Acidimicrobiia bacterium]